MGIQSLETKIKAKAYAEVREAIRRVAEKAAKTLAVEVEAVTDAGHMQLQGLLLDDLIAVLLSMHYNDGGYAVPYSVSHSTEMTAEKARKCREDWVERRASAIMAAVLATAGESELVTVRGVVVVDK